MILDKLKVLAVLTILGVAGTGAGVALSRPAGADAPAKPDAPPVKAAAAPNPAAAGERSLPMAMLRQKPPDEYRVDAGDVLGVFIENVLGDRNSVPPIINIGFSTVRTPPPPAIGFPVTVQDNGALLLPLVEPVAVRGKSIPEVIDLIVRTYLPTKIIPPGARVMVTLAKPRTYRVTVVRERAASQKGIVALDLPAYENDVLTALARSGGLSQFRDDDLVIQRGSAASGTTAGAVLGGIQYIRIPLKVRSDQPLPFKPEDIILKNGDVLTFESNVEGPTVAMSMAVAFPYGDILVHIPNGGWKSFDRGTLTATEIDGKAVANVAERLKTMTPVLVAINGRPPTGQDLQLANPGTLVLILKN